MKSLRVLFILVFACSLTAALRADEEWQRVRLFPGESYTFQGVQVHWEVTQGQAITTATLGQLVFRGPSSTVETVKPRPSGLQVVYLDQTAFQIGSINLEAPEVVVEFEGKAQPARYSFSGAPVEKDLLISNSCPLTVNDWQFTIPDTPVRFPDGKEHFELIGANEKTKEHITLPLVRGAYRTFGRFRVEIWRATEASRAASIRIRADKDESIRGRGAFVANLQIPERTAALEDFLEPLAAKCGFRVEWAPAPGHSESVDYMKRLRPYVRFQAPGPSDVEAALNFLLARDRNVFELNRPSPVALSWPDDTTLRVSPVDYEQVLKNQEEQATRQREAMELQAKVEAERESMEKLFDKDYATTTVIYALRRITPLAAKSFVDPKLTEYRLIDRENAPVVQIQHQVEAGLRPSGDSVHMASSLESEKGRYAIAAANPSGTPLLWQATQSGITDLTPQSTLRMTKEVCVADEKANALIVTAIPKTQQEVRVLLDQMEGMLVRGESSTPPRLCKIEAVLLSGRREEARARGPMRYYVGIVVESPTEAGRRQKELEKAGYSAVSVRRASTPTTRPRFWVVDVGQRFDTPSEASALASQLNQEGFSGATVNEVPPGPEESAQPEEPKAEAKPTPAPAASEGQRLVRDYGLRPEDLRMFQFDRITELGKAAVGVAAERGDMGRAIAALTDRYQCELEFQDERAPYIILRGRLTDTIAKRTVLENTIYLEVGKPSLLGVTNLDQALILILRLDRIDAPKPVAPSPATPQ